MLDCRLLRTNTGGSYTAKLESTKRRFKDGVYVKLVETLYRESNEWNRSPRAKTEGRKMVCCFSLNGVLPSPELCANPSCGTPVDRKGKSRFKPYSKVNNMVTT